MAKRCLIERVGANGYNYLFAGDTLYCDNCMRLVNFDTFLWQTLHDYGYNTIVYYDYIKGIHCRDDDSWHNYAKILLNISDVESGARGGTTSTKEKQNIRLSIRQTSKLQQNSTQEKKNPEQSEKDEDTKREVTLSYEERLQEKEKSLRRIQRQTTFDQIQTISALLNNVCLGCRVAIIADEKLLESDFQGFNDAFDNALVSWSKNQKNTSLFLWVFNEGTAQSTYDALMQRAENDRYGVLKKRLVYLSDLAKLAERRSEDNPRPKTIVETLLPTVAELRNYLNRLRVINAVQYNINDLETLAECLYSICKKKQYRLADLHMEIQKLQGKSITCENIKSFFEVYDARSAAEQLNDMIGMSTIKKVVEDIRNQYARKLKQHSDEFISRLETAIVEERGVKDRVHFCLLGNPGTGKTTVAGILGQVLKEIGYLSSGHLVKCPATSLATGYYGASAKLMSQKVEEALGGVLFIDDIASLLSQHPAEKDEINGILLDAMTSYSDLCVVIAGYPTPTKQYLESDAGLARRFTYPIELPDYTPEELAEIFVSKAERGGFTVLDSLKDVLPRLFDRMYQSLPQRERERWGNAGTADNLYLEMRRVAEGRAETAFTLEHLPNVFSYGSQKFELKRLLEWGADPINEAVATLSIPPIAMIRELENNNKSQEYLEETILAIRTEGGGEGTAFLITPNGFALTCAHVIEGKRNIVARVRRRLMYGGYIDEDYRCFVVREDRSTDVALIRLMKNLKTESSIVDGLSYVKIENDMKMMEYPSLMNIQITGYPGGVSANDNISSFVGRIASKQIKDGIESYMIDIKGIRGNSGSPVVDQQTGVAIGIFVGSELYGDEKWTEELQQMRPIKYAWRLFEKRSEIK